MKDYKTVKEHEKGSKTTVINNEYAGGSSKKGYFSDGKTNKFGDTPMMATMGSGTEPYKPSKMPKEKYMPPEKIKGATRNGIIENEAPEKVIQDISADPDTGLAATTPTGGTRNHTSDVNSETGINGTGQ